MSQSAPSTAYRSSVVAPLQIALGVVSGAVIGIVLIAINPSLWWLAVLVLLLTTAVGIYLAPVTVTVSAREIDLGQGRGGPEPRSIRTSDIAETRAEELTWAQCFGIGLPEEGTRDTRLTVRPGPTLRLTLDDGEVLRVSVTDPNAALAALGRPVPGDLPAPEEPIEVPAQPPPADAPAREAAPTEAAQEPRPRPQPAD